MSQLMLLKQALEETGLKFKEKDRVFYSFWKIENEKSAILLIYLDDTEDWIKISSKIGNLGEISESKDVLKQLLRFNNTILGPKVTIDKENNLLIHYEMLMDSLSSENLKTITLQIVNAYKKIWISTLNRKI
ncbi:MAG: hypothetical protein GF364_15110 [Candidatus Lokiarchaeota archaeon]|nr:hypothetical protein [Candidatus Lokiarchaeota archaeon]